MGNMLKTLREQRRWTQEETAERFGLSLGGYRKLENGQRSLDQQHLDRAALVYDITRSEVLGDERAPDPVVEIIGRAGAGPDGSVLFADGDQNFGEVPAPIGATATTKALEVAGNSMYGLANDGWLLFYDERTEPMREYMGEPCVCWLPDGRVLVKIPRPGSSRGLFHLESVNAPPMYDMTVEQMALVTDIKPRRAAQKYIRRNPDHPVEDVHFSK